MKYKLINAKNGETHLCDKVTINGFDYYVSENKVEDGYVYHIEYGIVKVIEVVTAFIKCSFGKEDKFLFPVHCKSVIATNNPNIGIPQVVDVIEKEVMSYLDRNYSLSYERTTWQKLHEKTYREGYNKAKEDFGNSDEDMIGFLQFYKSTARLDFNSTGEHHGKPLKQLLQLWKEQQPKKVYYE